MGYWCDETLSPDPTRGRAVRAIGDGWQGLDVHPHALAWANHIPPAVQVWANALDLEKPMSPVVLQVKPEDGELDLVLDFGTELEGGLELAFDTQDTGTIAISFGESVREAREWGLPILCEHQRPRKQHWLLEGTGTHRRTFEEGGFRFVRIRCADFRQPFTLRSAVVHARFALGERLGAFRCSDELFTRIWHNSVYTARLCTRPNAFWDGVKRDRLGWYGDARITSQTVNLAWQDPQPAMGMLLRLPTTEWANGIPNFSFDAVTMLKNHILAFGLDAPGVRAAYEKTTQMLTWALASHAGEDGRLYRAEGCSYFFNIGFIDWSAQPLGGRLEEIGPVQFSFAEALADAITLATWLDDESSVRCWSEALARLRKTLRRLFWQDGRGFHHTLRQAEPPGTAWSSPLIPDVHFQKTYIEARDYGPSGPTRHSAARAVWAGLAQEPAERALLTQQLSGADLPPIVTGYYEYYTAYARAACGDVDAAIDALRRYFGQMIREWDSPTVWEMFQPQWQDIRNLALSGWPRSLCHGWSSGTVPVTARFLLGIEPVEPGMRAIRLAPPARLPWAIEASIPTIHGPIEVRSDGGTSRVQYRVPKTIQVLAQASADVVRVNI